MNRPLLTLPSERRLWLPAKGKLVYDPPRPGMKKRVDWWAIVTADREITRYYRWWVDKSILNPMEVEGHGLKKPSWDAHVSVVRGEKPAADKMHLWRKYHGEEIAFEYKHEVRQSGDTTGGDRPNWYWFVEVKCPRLDEIRTELGLRTGWKHHLTIGRTYE